MTKYQLLGDRASPPPAFKLSFRIFALVTVLLPLAGFLSCIFLSVILHSEDATATHCKVPNVLPSISAAIGGFQPERYIWRVCIALHASPRLLVGTMYHRHYTHYLGKVDAFRNIVRASTALYTVENLALIGISYVSSIENKHVHETCFILFTSSFLLYTIFSIGLSSSVINPSNECEQLSKKAKVLLLIVNVTSLVTALYCFYRHNKYCEPYVYTFFAFFEYIFVLTNMGFHMTAYWDFYNYEFSIGPGFSQKIR